MGDFRCNSSRRGHNHLPRLKNWPQLLGYTFASILETVSTEKSKKTSRSGAYMRLWRRWYNTMKLFYGERKWELLIASIAKSQLQPHNESEKKKA